MKKTRIIYWIFTGLLSAFMLMSSIPDILVMPQAVTIFKHLGYPTYLIFFLGVAKFLAVVAILIPGFPRIKEWAYAGLAYDLVGATYSSIAVGDPAMNWLFMLIPIVLLVGSYVFYHKKLKSELLVSR